MGQTGTVVNKFESYNTAELEKMSTKDLVEHANVMLEHLGESTVKRFATRAAGIERIERLQRQCSQFVDVEDDDMEEGNEYPHDSDDDTRPVGVTESYPADDVPVGTPVNVPGFTVAQTADNEDFVKAAREQLDEWLTQTGYLKPKGGRGRSKIQGLSKTIRSAFPTVGHTLSDAEFRAAVAQYEWADVVRMLARERSDYGKGINGPVYISKVEVAGDDDTDDARYRYERTEPAR